MNYSNTTGTRCGDLVVFSNPKGVLDDLNKQVHMIQKYHTTIPRNPNHKFNASICDIKNNGLEGFFDNHTSYNLFFVTCSIGTTYIIQKDIFDNILITVNNKKDLMKEFQSFLNSGRCLLDQDYINTFLKKLA
jgi:hypothetical protein